MVDCPTFLWWGSLTRGEDVLRASSVNSTGLSHDDFRRAHDEYRLFNDEFRTALVTFVPSEVRVSSAFGDKTSGSGEAGDHPGEQQDFFHIRSISFSRVTLGDARELLYGGINPTAFLTGSALKTQMGALDGSWADLLQSLSRIWVGMTSNRSTRPRWSSAPPD